MLGRFVDVDLGGLDRWCQANLQTGVARIIFHEGYLSTVLGAETTSGGQVVVKIRRPAERLEACGLAHRRLFDAGLTCPEPLVGLEPFGPFVASAEALISGGDSRTPGALRILSPKLWRCSSPRRPRHPRYRRWSRPFPGPARIASGRLCGQAPTTETSTSTPSTVRTGLTRPGESLEADSRNPAIISSSDIVIGVPAICAGQGWDFASLGIGTASLQPARLG
jgi:hypothetical protein